MIRIDADIRLYEIAVYVYGHCTDSLHRNVRRLCLYDVNRFNRMQMSTVRNTMEQMGIYLKNR